MSLSSGSWLISWAILFFGLICGRMRFLACFFFFLACNFKWCDVNNKNSCFLACKPFRLFSLFLEMDEARDIRILFWLFFSVLVWSGWYLLDYKMVRSVTESKCIWCVFFFLRQGRLDLFRITPLFSLKGMGPKHSMAKPRAPSTESTGAVGLSSCVFACFYASLVLIYVHTCEYVCVPPQRAWILSIFRSSNYPMCHSSEYLVIS